MKIGEELCGANCLTFRYFQPRLMSRLQAFLYISFLFLVFRFFKLRQSCFPFLVYTALVEHCRLSLISTNALGLLVLCFTVVELLNTLTQHTISAELGTRQTTYNNFYPLKDLLYLELVHLSAVNADVQGMAKWIELNHTGYCCASVQSAFPASVACYAMF